MTRTVFPLVVFFFATLVFMIALSLLLSGSLVIPKRPAAVCRNINGTISLTDTSGPGCNSPVGLCWSAQYTGDLKGTSAFSASSTISNADSPTTGVVFITGDHTYHFHSGTVTSKAAISLKTSSPGDFSEVDVFTTGATGSIHSSGAFIDGAGQGSYSGQICTR
jgi:hypothetical protein